MSASIFIAPPQCLEIERSQIRRRRFSLRASDDLDGEIVLIGLANGERVAGEQRLAPRDQGDGVPPSALVITGEDLLGFLAVAAECHDEGGRCWSGKGDHGVAWGRSQLRCSLMSVGGVAS